MSHCRGMSGGRQAEVEKLVRQSTIERGFAGRDFALGFALSYSCVYQHCPSWKIAIAAVQ